MNKAELVEALAQHYDGSKAEASRALNAVVQTITRSTVAGEKVAITGFGVFEKIDRPARTVRNPRTGERKEAPATSVPRFRPGTELKAYVAGQRDLPPVSADAPAPTVRPARTSTRRPAAAAAPAEPVAEQEPLVAVPDAAEQAPAKAAKNSRKAAGTKADGTKADSKKADSKKADSKKADSKRASAAKADAKKASTKKAATKKADGKKADGKKRGKKG